MIRGLLAAIFVILVWGITFVNTKALLNDFSALEIHVLRIALGYLALLVFGRFTRFAKRLPFRDELLLFLMGLFGVALYQLLENSAIHYTNASNVSILVCMCPLLTAVVARFCFHGRRLHFLFFQGFVIAITGVTLVSMNGVQELHFRPLGDGLAALAMLSWVVYSNLVTVMGEKGYDQIFVIRRMFFWAFVQMLPCVCFGLTAEGQTALGGSFAVTLDAAANARRFASALNCMNLGFLGLLASAACFVLWNKALAIIGTVRCTVGLYLLPAITVVFAYLFLGETLTMTSGCGTVLILVGVILSGWRKV